jgi:archaetidylserine synthase
VNRPRQFQTAANLATLVNALLGIDAIAYTLAGNKLFALLLIVGAIGFDGLDGMLHRQGGGPPTVAGRVLDSAADTISFGIAPGVLLAVHSYAFVAYAPYALAMLLAGVLVSALAIARLVYFTLRSHVHPHFVGASTPQTTLAIVVLLLFADQPGYLGPQPLLLLVGALVLAPLMVLPIPYPKLRRGARLRRLMTGTSVALALTLLVVQFVPARGSLLYLVGELGAIAAAAGIATFYLLGPRAVRDAPEPPGGALTHA